MLGVAMSETDGRNVGNMSEPLAARPISCEVPMGGFDGKAFDRCAFW